MPIRLLLQFAWWMLVAFGAVVALLIMPGWWFTLMASVLLLAVVLGIGAGMGATWAKRASKWLFWIDV